MSALREITVRLDDGQQRQAEEIASVSGVDVALVVQIIFDRNLPVLHSLINTGRAGVESESESERGSDKG